MFLVSGFVEVQLDLGFARTLLCGCVLSKKKNIIIIFFRLFDCGVKCWKFLCASNDFLFIDKQSIIYVLFFHKTKIIWKRNNFSFYAFHTISDCGRKFISCSSTIPNFRVNVNSANKNKINRKQKRYRSSVDLIFFFLFVHRTIFGNREKNNILVVLQKLKRYKNGKAIQLEISTIGTIIKVCHIGDTIKLTETNKVISLV